MFKIPSKIIIWPDCETVTLVYADGNIQNCGIDQYEEIMKNLTPRRSTLDEVAKDFFNRDRDAQSVSFIISSM